MTPQRLGSRYLLHEQIGQGGMGVVWRAEDVEAGVWRAVKVLRPEYARDPAAVARFVRERTALLALRHPGVVTLHDMIVEGERLALVMDLLSEGDLGRFRREHGGTLPAGLAAESVAQVCDGLAAAHAAGIVHRDLKPGNVLMDRGRARLTDFGIARIGGESPVTAPGTVAGTVSYMAPEALAGAEPAPACDVYAAGVTLYELLAGRPPFTGQPAMVIYAHLHTAPPRPDGLPGPLWPLIAACLAKDPAARPAAAQLAAALRAPRLTAALPAPQLPGAEPLGPPAGPGQREATGPDGPDAGPHTVTGIGWLSPAGPVPRGPVPPAPAPPRAAEKPAGKTTAGKRRRTWGIAAAAALVVAGAAAGALAARTPGSAATPEANTVTAAPVTGQASPAATTHSPSPAPSRSKAAPPTSSDPPSPASAPSAALPSADTAGSASPSASATTASPTPTATISPAKASVEVGTYQLQNIYHSECLTEDGDTGALYLQACGTGTDINHSQLWKFTAFGQLVNDHSGLCLIVTGDDPGVWLTGGTACTTAPVSVAEWNPVSQYESPITNGHTGYYLDADTSDNGTIIQSKTNVDGINWTMEPAS